MKPVHALLGVALLATACASPAAPAGEEMSPDDIMAAMMELAQPGAEHAAFDDHVGTWKTAMKSYWEPGGEPMLVQGTSVIETIMGGRYMVETFTADFMGMPFEGRLIHGYDNLADEYWSIWFDNMSTWPSFSTGQMDADGTLEMSGTMKDAQTPNGRPSRSVITTLPGGGQHFTMYDVTPEGDEFVVMEIDYTKA